MDRTTIICTDTENTLEADVLERSAMRMKVALDGSEIALELYKETPNSPIYIGHKYGMEFTSTGD